jgi:hypothetical protein
MQQTKLDQWLKARFIHETHILTLRLPDEPLPKGVEVKPTGQTTKGAYQHKLIVKSNEKAEKVIVLLKENHFMHSVLVVEGRHWYNKFIAPQGLSFTYRWILRGLGLVLLLSACWGIYILMQNADLMKSMKETMKHFQ